MLHITIKNGQLVKNGQNMELSRCRLGQKVTDLFTYLLNNNIDFTFEKKKDIVSFSELRPDLKKRFVNALIAEKVIRPNRLNTRS